MTIVTAPRVWAVIPARGGSKGIPRKNLAELAGAPLIAHAIRAARAHPAVARAYVSTDDPEIAAAARAEGAEVPFLRPGALAADDVPLLPVVQHLCAAVPDDVGVDTVLLLQPTNPFRLREDIHRALEKLWSCDCDCVVSLSPRDTHPLRARLLDNDRPRPLLDAPQLYAQRQDFPSVFYLDGCVVAVRRDRLARQTHYFGTDQRAIVVDRLSGLDIDTPFDLELARWLAVSLPAALYVDSPQRQALLAQMT